MDMKTLKCWLPLNVTVASTQFVNRILYSLIVNYATYNKAEKHQKNLPFFGRGVWLAVI